MITGTKAYSDGYLNIVFVPINGLAKPSAPTEAEIAAGQNISVAVAWDGTTFPNMTDSSEVEDRSILDSGNATSRGYSQYEGSLNMFYPRDLKDTVSDFGKTFQMLRTPGAEFWVITRILQNVKGQASPFQIGQFISVYKFIADTFINELEGEDSYKYLVELLQQGFAVANTLVAPVPPATVVNASGSDAISVGDHAVLRATLAGHRANQIVRWTSSAPDVAFVSQNGVVTGISAGTAEITVTHPSATGDSTAIEITVS